MEVLVSDDCSADDTWDKVSRIAEAYSGPHRLRIHQQSENLGPLRNNRWLRQNATGDWLITNDGDDISLPGRVAAIMHTAREHKVSFVSSNTFLIDAQGRRKGTYLPRSGIRLFGFEELAREGFVNGMLGATSAFKKQLLTVFGYFTPERLVGGGGDHVLPLRSAFFGGALYIGEPLHCYRRHDAQQSRKIADRTQSSLVFNETLAAYDLKACIHQWEDARAWAKQFPDDPRGQTAADLVLTRLMRKVLTWNLFRNKLFIQGLRPTWRPGEELDRIAVTDGIVPAELVPGQG